MKKFIKILFVALLISAFVGPATLLADKDKYDGVKDALVQGADRQLSLQGTYGGITNTWEWVIGYGTGPNVQGISARGLLEAYEKTGDHRYLDGAILAGNTLIERYGAAIATFGVTYDARPWSTDVEFLAALGKTTKHHVYTDVAKNWYSIIPDNKTAAELVDRYLAARRASMAGWDLASQIRAAMVVGEKDYAKAVAVELIRRSSEWVNVLYAPGTSNEWDYTPLSYASLLWALDQLDEDEFESVIKQYRSALLALQAADGSWDGGDYQCTAYAILGLSAVKGKGSKEVLASAGRFLISSQAGNGGWPYVYGTASYEYGEVNSEVLMALAELAKKGHNNLQKEKARNHKEKKGEHKEKHGHIH
jgi:hypothetical protein